MTVGEVGDADTKFVVNAGLQVHGALQGCCSERCCCRERCCCLCQRPRHGPAPCAAQVVGTTNLNSLRVRYTTQLGMEWKGEFPVEITHLPDTPLAVWSSKGGNQGILVLDTGAPGNAATQVGAGAAPRRRCPPCERRTRAHSLLFSLPLCPSPVPACRSRRARCGCTATMPSPPPMPSSLRPTPSGSPWAREAHV